ncbi:hypothetical protein F4803DRAFT_527358 [Xylaria telfairii]|nr:hypothetical protein F4803DRAFT_527358 [Xylaria telfairii]
MPGLRLLALDGGGVRGLVTLTILKRLLYLMNPEKPPKPCDVFDFIAGTSTGGLIAIMLGLFEMDVQTCIDAYLDLSKLIFKPRMRAKLFHRLFLNVLGQAPYDHKLLEQEIKRLASEVFKDENAPLYQENTRCKVFVCASLSNTQTVRLRSYASKREDRIHCTIWEAGRATSAAPMFFDPITFSNGLQFRDGALRANNPTYELVQEVLAEFPSEEISAIVSVGTGIPTSIIIDDTLASVGKACGKIATDTEKSASWFEEAFCSPGQKFDGKYFRFNVTRGVDKVQLEEWHKADIMISNTIGYLMYDSTLRQLRACVRALGGIHVGESPPSLRVQTPGPSHSPKSSHWKLDHNRTPTIDNDNTWPPQGIGTTSKALIITDNRSRPFENSFYQLDRIGKAPVPYFVFREELDQIHSHFQTVINHHRSRVVCLLGLGGSGKTQLALQYAWSRRESFGVVLWIDARSRTDLTASFKLAASLLGLRLPPHQAAPSSDRAVGKYKSELESDVNAVKQELLRRNQSWLMIFDQADDDELFEELEKSMPSDSNGHILLSSRRKAAYRLGQKYFKIEGLPLESARDLLLYHAGIQDPTQEQVDCADEIVYSLDYIALAVDLAGGYIQNPAGLQLYLDLYKTNREELYKRSLGKTPSKLTGYNMSVFAAWRVSITAIPENTARFLHLLCFLDPTNLSKDLFRRACTEKPYWTKTGERGLLGPSQNGVPSWLMELLCDSAGHWSEFQFHEVFNQLASFFFVRQEILEGSWLHQTGPVDSDSLAKDGNTVALLKLPRPLHDLGRYYHKPETRVEYCNEAFSVLLHGFHNDISEAGNIDATSHEAAVLYVGRGGVAKNAPSLQRQLEEFEKHIQILRCDIDRNTAYSRLRNRCFDYSHAPWYIGELIMFASIWWQDLVHDYNHSRSGHQEGPTTVSSPWETVMEIANALLPRVPAHVSFSESGTWTGPNQAGWTAQSEESSDIAEDPLKTSFEKRWVLQQSKYHDIISKSDIFAGSQSMLTSTTLYRIASAASSMAFDHRWPPENILLDALSEWVRTEIGEIHPPEASTTKLLLFDQWQRSHMGQSLLRKRRLVHANQGRDQQLALYH